MKKIATALAPLVAFFAPAVAPAVAMACPGSAAYESGSACGSHSCGYVSAVGIGLLLGMGSIAVERVLKKK